MLLKLEKIKKNDKPDSIWIRAFSQHVLLYNKTRFTLAFKHSSVISTCLNDPHSQGGILISQDPLYVKGKLPRHYICRRMSSGEAYPDE